MSENNHNRPDLIAYSVTEGSGDKKFFNRLGAAWANAKGGYGIRLFGLPTNGEIVLLPPSEKPDEPKGP